MPIIYEQASYNLYHFEVRLKKFEMSDFVRMIGLVTSLVVSAWWLPTKK